MNDFNDSNFNEQQNEIQQEIEEHENWRPTGSVLAVVCCADL